jgi:hypothetical protein
VRPNPARIPRKGCLMTLRMHLLQPARLCLSSPRSAS